MCFEYICLLAYRHWKRETAIAAGSPWSEWLPVARALYSANGTLSDVVGDQVNLRSVRTPIGIQGGVGRWMMAEGLGRRR